MKHALPPHIVNALVECDQLLDTELRTSQDLTDDERLELIEQREYLNLVLALRKPLAGTYPQLAPLTT